MMMRREKIADDRQGELRWTVGFGGMAGLTFRRCDNSVLWEVAITRTCEVIASWPSTDRAAVENAKRQLIDYQARQVRLA